ncbi:MAG TPA: peptidase E [Iamia sp.]|nr:peptidase E [Iamia sp.]
MAEQIVVSGGASFWWGPEGLDLDRRVLALTGRDRPRVCYLATASGDAEGFIRPFYETLEPWCEPSHLPLFLPPYRLPEEALADQDLIYVGGGSTANLLAVWRRHGIDRLLRAALERGTILYGSSAGGLCWFASGVTDSLGFDGELHPLTDGLGFLAGSHCPHYDHEGRPEAYAAMVGDGRLPDGLAVDDLAAVHHVDGRIRETFAAAAGSTAHRVARAPGGGVTITPLPATPI